MRQNDYALVQFCLARDIVNMQFINVKRPQMNWEAISYRGSYWKMILIKKSE